MSAEGARAVLSWRYAEPYDFYNADPGDVDNGMKALLDPANSYYGVEDARGELVAYCCFGPDARVPGGDYSLDALDVGGGLRPDLTGAGLGLGMLQAVLRCGGRRFAPPVFRVAVAAWNRRALLVCERAGFRAAGRFEPEGGGSFAILLRPTGGAASRRHVPDREIGRASSARLESLFRPARGGRCPALGGYERSATTS